MDEFEIIRRYFAGPISYRHDGVVLGPGDDCAVVQIPAGHELCVSTDTLIEGVHFPLAADGELVASRALAVNLSDLAAMGADVYGFTLALTLPGYSEPWLASFSRRLNEMVNDYKIPLLGGNLSKGTLSLTVNIMGLVPKNQSLQRATAQLDDDIYVSGYLGDAAGGLALVTNAAQNTGDDSQHGMIERYANPLPRLSLGTSLRGLATSAIDISDGFAADLGHICAASQLGAIVALESLPVSGALVSTFGQEKALAMAVHGGDDYELCFTVASGKAAEIDRIQLAEGIRITRVGKISATKGVEIIDRHGQRYLDTRGYTHF